MGLQEIKQRVAERKNSEPEQEPSPTTDSSTDTESVVTEVEVVPAPDGNTSVGDILQNDGGVDSLTTWEIKDVWVRMTVGKVLFRHETQEDIPRAVVDTEQREKKLATEEEGLREVLRSDYKPDSPHRTAAESAITNEQLVEKVFGLMTKDHDEETLVDSARKKIKSALRSSGMPASTVARQRVQYHNE